MTGSAGKSGTKEFLAAMLAGSHAAKSSYNNFWGVPLTLANMPANAPYAVVEMGMNRPGEIARLSQLTQPDVALVVNVRPVHLEALGSLEAIRQEKLSIRRGLASNGVLVVPTDLSLAGLDRMPSTVVRFGNGGEIKANDWHAHGDDWHVSADVDGEDVDMMIQQGAPHRLQNALAALACCWAVGADARTCAQRAGLVSTMPGRGVVNHAGSVTLIDDSFNANPASVAAALQGLVARATKGRRIAILGDMLELGGDSAAYHAGLAAECRHLDGVVCVGPLMKNLYDALPAGVGVAYYPDPATVEPRDVAKRLVPGDTVVIKGSKKIFWVRNFAKELMAELER